MKKYFLLAAMMYLCLGTVSALTSAFDVGIGSGYVFYGNTVTKNRIDALDDPAQIVLQVSAAYKIRIAEPLWISIGADTAVDFRWSDGDHVHLFDYAGLLGMQVYPGLAGLVFGVDYALGRRTDFYRLNGGSHTDSSHWGNGFKISILYDFFYQSEKKVRPLAGIAWRRMPRGDGADNILSVFCKLTIQ
mgnify:CR=1 FL=1